MAMRTTAASQPRGLERLVDVAPLAPDRLGDRRRAHALLAQLEDLGAVECRRPALVDALGLRRLDAGPLPVLEEGQLHLRDHAWTLQTFRPLRPALVSRRRKNP